MQDSNSSISFIMEKFSIKGLVLPVKLTSLNKELLVLMKRKALTTVQIILFNTHSDTKTEEFFYYDEYLGRKIVGKYTLLFRTFYST